MKLKTPKLFLQLDSERRDVKIEELTKEVPHVWTPAEERDARRHPWKSFPTTDDVPTGKLRLTVYRDGWQERGGSNRDEWDDAPKKPLSDQIATIARAIKKGVIDDQDAHARAEQARAEAQERHEKQRAEQQQAWEAQRQKATAKAAEQLRRWPSLRRWTTGALPTTCAHFAVNSRPLPRPKTTAISGIGSRGRGRALMSSTLRPKRFD